MTAPSSELTLGILLPCRNEAQVLARKLANLAACDWPRSTRPHRLLVVDDGSSDGTAERARSLGQALRGGAAPEVEVIPNRARPGKSGAIAQGLAELSNSVDLVVLTDADVIFDPRALCALVRRFQAEPRLGLACGAQHFMRDLAQDGSCRGANGAALEPADGLYDRLTSRVRALESRRGLLFSLHGQLAAWRRELELRPTPGIAADDLDFMLQARLSGWRVERVAEARFFEVKTPAGPLRKAQAQRRARAFVQFLEHPQFARLFSSGSALLARLQARAYRWLPTAAPWLALALALALVGACAWRWGWLGLAASALALAAFASCSVGRRLASLLALIARATRLEAQTSLAEQWDTPRGRP